jgi:thiamine pyrophosphate-dependent acetolactate synthase large subunit-like protein
LRADARLGAEALTAALPARAKPWRTEAMAARIRTSKPDSQLFEIEPGLLDPRDVIEALEKTLPADWEMVNSGGHCSWFFAQMPSRPNDLFLTIREFGAIGNGSSFAMGVAAARPDKQTVLFDGDGSLIMHIQELETIKRHALNILIILINDGAYGSEVHKLRSEGLPDTGSVFGRPDFAAIARGFGLEGRTFTSLDDLPKAVQEFSKKKGGAALWDFHVSDRVLSPTIRRAHPPKHGKK